MNQPFRYDPANPTKFRDLKARYFSCERLTPEGFDAYVKTNFRGLPYNSKIPQSGIEALRNYIFDGTPPGDFMTALLCNDLMETMGRADDWNIMVIPWYCGILYNYMPAIMKGSREAISQWVDICYNAREEEAAEKEASIKLLPVNDPRTNSVQLAALEAEAAETAAQEEEERHTDYS